MVRCEVVSASKFCAGILGSDVFLFFCLISQRTQALGDFTLRNMFICIVNTSLLIVSICRNCEVLCAGNSNLYKVHAHAV